MKIVHIAPNATYNEGWGYQENLLPKYQVLNGHEVYLITTTMIHKNNKINQIEEGEYLSKDKVYIIRKKYKKIINSKLTNLFAYIPVANLLEKIEPDFIFFHGLVSTTIIDVVNFVKKKKKCIVVQDNHMDYQIGPSDKTLIQKCQKKWYRILNKYSIKYVSKVYGVTPWREEYAMDYFGIPKEKIDLLVMGADTEKIPFVNTLDIRKEIRKKLNLKEDDFIIITGGKIDRKKNIHILMKAITEIKEEKIKLIVFGEIEKELSKEIENIKKHNKIYILGWISGEEVYKYYLTSDLAIFPGQHSVLWEQACGCGLPCIFKEWVGMYHVDVGGNSEFIKEVTVENIKEKILYIYNNKEKYNYMKKIAKEKGIIAFSYNEIAKKALEI